MIVVNGIFEMQDGAVSAVQPALAQIEAACKDEAGCHDYTFSVELNSPDVLRLTEKWDDIAALRAHFQQPHMADMRNAMSEHPPKSGAAQPLEHCVRIGWRMNSNWITPQS